MFSLQRIKQKKKEYKPENASQNEYDTIEQEDKPKTYFMRCISCFSIPLLSLNSQSHILKMQCDNGHENDIEINEYIGKCFNENLNNILCSSCNSILNLKNMENI